MRTRSRVPSQFKHLAERVVLSSAGSSTTSAGALASMMWMRSLGLTPPVRDHWHVDIVLDALPDGADFEPDEMLGTRFRIEIDRDEWGFAFCHQERVSWIRVTNVPFVLVGDAHALLDRTPPLRQIGELLRALERQHGIAMHRASASITTTLPKVAPAIRGWVESL